MLVFMRCVAEAVVARGVRGLLELVPGGGFVHDVAEEAWRRLRERQRDNELRAEVERLAAASPAEAQDLARQTVAAVGLVGDEAVSVAQYLAGIPLSVRQSLKRPEDPSGKSVAGNFSVRSADDMARLLPQVAPRFKPGDRPAALRGWVLEELLGAGGFGEVWKARHPSFGNLRAAIKFARGLSDGERALLHEGNVINRVMGEGRHPGIVPLQDAHLDGDMPWLRFEYVEGGDLSDLVRLWQRLPINERLVRAVACLRELAGTVGHFHRLDPPIVHRDLKPSNILLDRTVPGARLPEGLDFLPRIADFGIGGLGARRQLKEESEGTTKAAKLVSALRGSYTLLYASPQQRDGAEPDTRDDVHALGVIGYQLVTGNLHLGAGPDFAEDLREARADEELIKVLARCVAQRADRRWADAAELAQQLEVIRAERSVGVELPKPAPAPKQSDDGERRQQAEKDWVRGEDYRLGRGVAQDYAEALRWFRKAAEQGNAQAQSSIGWLYGHGKGVVQDYVEALRWFRKAADQGHADAQVSIGVLYHNGLGVARDYAEAMQWFRKAADRGHAKAHFSIGVMYHHGQGVPRDYAEAMRWYRQAADQGNADAQINIGVLYHNGLGVAQDYAEAMRWYRQAADQGDAWAQNSLGELYRDGLGVPQDYPEAIQWFRKAADQGHADAQVSIGVLHHNGLGVARDYAEAMRWYRQAADQGNAIAQNNIGVMHQRGLGVAQDYAEAMRWYRQAADQGYATAQSNIGSLYLNGWGVAEDYAEAMRWYRQAADQGYATAQSNIGSLYLNGWGVAKDVQQAITWYRKAAVQGLGEAQAALKRLGAS
jgi:TPR repeat protein/serine/threonine protein kinase